MKAYWGTGHTAPSILDLGTWWRWVVSFTPRPLYSQGKRPWYTLDGKQGLYLSDMNQNYTSMTTFSVDPQYQSSKPTSQFWVIQMKKTPLYAFILCKKHIITHHKGSLYKAQVEGTWSFKSTMLISVLYIFLLVTVWQKGFHFHHWLKLRSAEWNSSHKPWI